MKDEMGFTSRRRGHKVKVRDGSGSSCQETGRTVGEQSDGNSEIFRVFQMTLKACIIRTVAY